jgi:hypothetical protein
MIDLVRMALFRELQETAAVMKDLFAAGAALAMVQKMYRFELSPVFKDSNGGSTSYTSHGWLCVAIENQTR